MRRVALAYNPFNDWGQASTFTTPLHPLADLDANAQKYRISGYESLEPTDVQAVKQKLAEDRPVAIGVPVFQDAWFGSFTESTGEIQMPLTRPNPDGTETLLDKIVGGHAIALIGYCDTPDPNDVANYRPGGGYFTFKNSWGTRWAPDNPLEGPGFGVLPYAYLKKYNTDAYIIR
jgi:hypothetical protein